MVVAAMVIYVAILLVALVISVAGLWKMFVKAGEAGWKSIIPVYSGYVMYKMCWNTKMFWIALVVNIILTVTLRIDNVFAYIICFIFAIANLVIFAKQNVYMAKAFGKGIPMGLLLLVFPVIGDLILGFGKAEYIGNQSETK